MLENGWIALLAKMAQVLVQETEYLLRRVLDEWCTFAGLACRFTQMTRKLNELVTIVACGPLMVVLAVVILADILTLLWCGDVQILGSLVLVCLKEEYDGREL